MLVDKYISNKNKHKKHKKILFFFCRGLKGNNIASLEPDILLHLTKLKEL